MTEVGKFIVFEGADKLGKTTQSKLLCELLKGVGVHAKVRGYPHKLRQTYDEVRNLIRLTLLCVPLVLVSAFVLRYLQEPFITLMIMILVAHVTYVWIHITSQERKVAKNIIYDWFADHIMGKSHGDYMTRARLFAKDREEQLISLHRNLRDGTHYIADRYYWSGINYTLAQAMLENDKQTNYEVLLSRLARFDKNAARPFITVVLTDDGSTQDREYDVNDRLEQPDIQLLVNTLYAVQSLAARDELVDTLDILGSFPSHYKSMLEPASTCFLHGRTNLIQIDVTGRSRKSICTEIAHQVFPLLDINISEPELNKLITSAVDDVEFIATSTVVK